MARKFLRLTDLTEVELATLLGRAGELKAEAAERPRPGAGALGGRSVGLIFEKSSTRTRVSFEVGIHQLGGQPVVLGSNEIQLKRGETIADTARTLSRYLHAVVIRTFGQDRLEEFASFSSIPVINALTDLHHPCQALADLLTIREKLGTLKGRNLTYIGDGNNVAHSLIEAAGLTGLNVTIACPRGYEPEDSILEEAEARNSGKVRVVYDVEEAARSADVLYTDVWVSMGQEEEEKLRRRLFSAYRISDMLLRLASPDAIVMHCLPAHRGDEIDSDVMDGPQSVVFDQAENRLHTQKALLEFLVLAAEGPARGQA